MEPAETGRVMEPAETVHVWIADLDGEASAFRSLLSDDERKRAASLRREQARSRWVAARSVLRAILGQHAGVDPRALRFELGAHGKPQLAAMADLQPGGGERLCFNVSHSGPLAVYALAWDREVGIDVELADRRRPASANELAIARRLLGDVVERRLAGLSGRLRTEAFLREWTAHEARVKCLGVGIGGVADDDTSAARLSGLWATELDAGAGAFAALAVEGTRASVLRRLWA